MNDKLKPCPFCASKPAFTSMSSDGNGWVLGCTNVPACPSRPQVWGRTRAEAHAGWNKRRRVPA